MRAKLLITAAVGAIMLAGCNVKDPIYNTPHPDQGAITLTTDWSATNIATPPAAGYTVRVGDYSATLTGATNTVNNLFEPGGYTIYAYTTADGITVSGTTATANYTGTLGWFYTGVQGVTVVKDTDHEFTVNMAQQVRQLTLVLEPTGGTIDRIATITGTLSGVAGTLDFATGAHGGTTTAGLTFAKSETAEYPGKWMATVRLLGVTDAAQTLDITLTYNDGTPADQLEDYDLATALGTFNTDKATPLTLGGQVIETPTEAGFTATITGWTTINGEDFTAN